MQVRQRGEYVNRNGRNRLRGEVLALRREPAHEAPEMEAVDERSLVWVL
jgi:hypothetical protein